MSKCLRCGAGGEWLQGNVPDDAAIDRLEREKAAALGLVAGHAAVVTQLKRERNALRAKLEAAERLD